MIKVIRNVGKRFICYRYVWSLYANIKLIVNKRYIIQIHPIKEKITENVLLNYSQFINCLLSFQIIQIVFCKTDKLPFLLLCHTSSPKSI